MIPVKQFEQSTKLLARNPLGIIALFIVLIYGFASIVAGASSQLQMPERYPMVWFLVLFPVLVLFIFAWLVSKHHPKLYAPYDYKNEETFYKLNTPTANPNLENFRLELEKQIYVGVNQYLSTIIKAGGSIKIEDIKKDMPNVITKQVVKSSFIRINASEFIKSPMDTFEFPIDAFATFSQLTTEVYFRIRNHVGPYEYGKTWVLIDEANGRVFRSIRMITNAPFGRPSPDPRTLDEVGIRSGMTLLVSKPGTVKKLEEERHISDLVSKPGRVKEFEEERYISDLVSKPGRVKEFEEERYTL